ncbi:GntR family transcriptional regulator [Falsiroseomonas sp. HW251]|uniref:GntR family transcriptional regulator n=1 Tax=Falsiroseomonas sp. HW251 TaxID=3390998 RepID=UPI003D31FE50
MPRRSAPHPSPEPPAPARVHRLTLPARVEPPGVDAPRVVIARTLEAEIVRGAFSPGERLDERALSQRFGVSRTPVREAIGHLVSQGLVETRARSGNYVARIALADVLLLFEAMAEFEALCGRYAGRRATRDEAAQLRRLAQTCAEVAGEGPDRYSIANMAFHDALYAAAHNAFLESAARQARQRAGVYRAYTLQLPGRLERSVAEHFGIADAVIAGDADAAHRRLLDHVDIRKEDYAPFLAMVAERERGAS